MPQQNEFINPTTNYDNYNDDNNYNDQNVFSTNLNDNSII